MWTTIIAELVQKFMATTAVTHTTVPIPATPTTPAKEIIVGPSEAVRSLQKVLVQVLKDNPPTGLKRGWPIKADGWLGEDTEKTINAALVMAKPYLALIGIAI